MTATVRSRPFQALPTVLAQVVAIFLGGLCFGGFPTTWAVFAQAPSREPPCITSEHRVAPRPIAAQQAPSSDPTAFHSPFGLQPACIIPPFAYGLEMPYEVAEELGVKWDRSLRFTWSIMESDLPSGLIGWSLEQQIRDTPNGIHSVANFHIGDPNPRTSLDPEKGLLTEGF